MLLGELLKPSTIKLELDAETKWEAIVELVDRLIEAHEIKPSQRQHIIDCVTTREKSLTTGMNHGVALPHGSSDDVDHTVAAMGLSKRGIDFDTIDGQLANIIVLMLVPRRNFQGQVRTLAGIAHLLGNQSFRESLASARDAGDVMKLIHSEEEKGGLDRAK